MLRANGAAGALLASVLTPGARRPERLAVNPERVLRAIGLAGRTPRYGLDGSMSCLLARFEKVTGVGGTLPHVLMLEDMGFTLRLRTSSQNARRNAYPYRRSQ